MMLYLILVIDYSLLKHVYSLHKTKPTLGNTTPIKHAVLDKISVNIFNISSMNLGTLPPFLQGD